MRFRPALDLLRQLVHRELHDRYGGSALGIAWALIVPISMLAIYTFVFGFVFRARWAGTGDDPFAFSLFLYCGLVPFLFVSDTLGRAPTLIRQHGALVKRVVFPMPLLAVATTAAATVHMLIGLGILTAFAWFVHGRIEPIALLALFAIVPLVLAVLGLVWVVAASTVYFRDLAQAVPALLPVILFLSPIFYPVSAVPEVMRDWMLLNPLTMVIENIRRVVITGAALEPTSLLTGVVLGSGLALAGFLWFSRLQPGFADVL
jgi:lipopolysaccharide transport system permease protein